MKHYYYAFFLAIVFTSCKASEPDPLVPGVAEIYEQIAPASEPQVFAISTNADTAITTRHGVEVMIPAGVLVDASGNPVTGAVELKIEEAFTNAEVFVRPLSTVADGKLLASKGMVSIEATKDGMTLQIKEGETMSLIFPGNETDYEGYELFYGVETPDGVIEWALDTVSQEAETVIETPASLPSVGIYFTTSKFDDGELGLKISDNMRSDLIDEFVDFNSFTEGELERFIATNTQIYFRLFNNGELGFHTVLGSLGETEKTQLLKRVEKMPGLKTDLPELEADIQGIFSFYPAVDFTPEYVDDKLLGGFNRTISRLGWTNCDVFLRLKMAISDMTVSKPNDSTIVKLIFPDYKTMLTGYEATKGKLSFDFVPVGKQVNVVAIAPYGEEVKMSITKTTVSKELDALATFEVVSKEEMTRRLNALN